MINSRGYGITVIRTDDGCYVVSHSYYEGDKNCVKNTVAETVAEIKSSIMDDIEKDLYNWVDSPPTLQDSLDKLKAQGIILDKEDKDEATS